MTPMSEDERGRTPWGLLLLLGLGAGVWGTCARMESRLETRAAERAARYRFTADSVARVEAARKQADADRLAGYRARANVLIPRLTPARVRQLPDSDLMLLWNLGPGFGHPYAGTLPRGAWWPWVDREGRRHQGRSPRLGRRHAACSPMAPRPPATLS